MFVAGFTLPLAAAQSVRYAAPIFDQVGVKADLVLLTAQTPAGERQDQIKLLRDRLATGLKLDPTLIATRSQLALLARDPAAVGTVLLPWQAQLLQSDPAWKA